MTVPGPGAAVPDNGQAGLETRVQAETQP